LTPFGPPVVGEDLDAAGDGVGADGANG